MRNVILAGMLFLSLSFGMAHAQDATVKCTATSTAIHNLLSKGYLPQFMGDLQDGENKSVLFVNKTNGRWIFTVMSAKTDTSNDTMTCIILDGTSGTLSDGT